MAKQYQEDVNVLRASIRAPRDEPARNRTHRDDSIVFKLTHAYSHVMGAILKQYK